MAKTPLALPKKTFQVLYKHTAKEGTQTWETWVEHDALNDFGVIHVRYGLVDGKQQEIAEVIKGGKNAGRKNATTAYQQACNEAQARWEKQLSRKGYGLTVGESAAVRAISPMLAHKYKDHAKKVDWANAHTQPKLDGFRLLAHRAADGTWSLYSRENQPMDALAHIKDALEGVPLRGKEGQLILDGEAYAHGMSLNKISSACKKKSELSEQIRFNVYDAVIGKADFRSRHAFVDEVVKAAATDALTNVPTVKVKNEAELMVCQREFIEQGYEGAMLRHGGAGYEAGKRSASLLKVKTFEDAEFEIVDVKFGRGGYAEVPILVCVTEDGHAFQATASGTMEEKKALGRRKDKLIGRIATVKYAGFTKTEEPVPFHPVVKHIKE